MITNINNYIDILNNNINYTNFYSPHFYLMGGSYKEKTRYKNNLSYNNTFFKLINIATHIFKWEFKTDYKFNKDVIELGYLMDNGVSLFLNENGFFILRARPLGEFNIYGEPLKVNVFGYNFNKEVVVDGNYKKYHGIYSYEFFCQYALINYVIDYANKISDKMRALDVLTQRLKSPFTALADKKDIENVKKAFTDLYENNDIIITNKKIDLTSGVELVNNNLHPELITAMKNSILFDYNQFLEYVGINTDPNPDKAERKLVDEINANNMLVNQALKTRLNAREDFCKRAKELYNIDIKVSVDFDFIENTLKEGADGLSKDNNEGQKKTARASKNNNKK